MNPQLNSMLGQAIQAFQAGDLLAAESILKRVLQAYKNNFPALNILGLIKASESKHAEAIDYLKKAVSINSNDPALQYNLAKVLSAAGMEIEAIRHHQKAVSLAPSNSEAWLNYGKSLATLKRYPDALNAFNKSIACSPAYLEALLSKSAVLNELGKYDEAIDCANTALRIRPDCAEAVSNKASAFKGLKRYEEAVMFYENALSLSPNSPDTWFNKANALVELRKFEDALVAYDCALRLNNLFADAWFNKANTLSQMKRYEDSLECCDNAIALNQSSAEARSLQGAVYFQQKNYAAAAAALGRALDISSDAEYALGGLIEAKLLAGDWGGRAEHLNQLTKKILDGKRVVRPFQFLSMIDSPELQLKVAELAVNHQFPIDKTLPIIKNDKHDRIRVGYFSGDFKNHAVSILTAELFEVHDRKEFEIFGFSFQDAPAGDKMRDRLVNAFDHFIDVKDKPDLEIVRLARDLEIDIAVDLAGLTQDSRPGVFALRVAPIQINYLGYPGTSGAKFMDYIVGDDRLIPPESRNAYVEKIIYMPDCFQVNDSKREISGRVFTREECGLPKDTFIYCCFNNLFKINPEIFSVWMKILSKAENTCLWLLEPDEVARKNFQEQAEVLGVDASRLIFAGRVSPEDYLSRYRVADLFLDTLPFNAGTTASDALWAGLPVLTCSGNSFAGRMATSLLHAAGLPELIADSLNEYADIAINLANNQQSLLRVRERLMSDRLSMPLFDVHKFSKKLEKAYTQVYSKFLNGLPPDNIHIQN